MNKNEFSTNSQEFGSIPEDVAAFNELTGSIRRHNDQFSMGAMLTRAFVDNVNAAERVQGLVNEGASLEDAEQAIDFVGDDKPTFSEEEEMGRAVVGFANMSTLRAAGLKFSPLRKIATMYSARAPQQSAGAIHFQIEDGGKFSGFLQNVDVSSDDLRNSVDHVIADVVLEAKALITSGQDNQVVLETLTYAPGVAAGLNHIGLDSNHARELGKLYEHSQIGDVREYVAADELGLLNTPETQKFGPSQWQKDSTNEYLAKKWREVLDVIQVLKDNPKASVLFNQLIESARASLSVAEADWNVSKSTYKGSTYGSKFDSVFESVGLELDFLASKEE